MTSRQPAPGYVGNITGNVIKGSGVDIRLVGESEKRDAGSDTGSENADAFITFLFQPAHRRARVKHGLAHRLNRATNVSTDQMIGALKFGWPPLLMIRKS